jgi:hypothetical protein
MIVKYYMVLWGTQPCVDVEDYGHRLHMAGAVPKVYSLARSWFPFRDLMPLLQGWIQDEDWTSEGVKVQEPVWSCCLLAQNFFG